MKTSMSPLLCGACDRPTTGPPGIHAWCPHCEDYKRTYTADLGKTANQLTVIARGKSDTNSEEIELFQSPAKGTIEVVSLKNRSSIPKNVVYVGRESKRLKVGNSPLANPFKIGVDGKRSQVCERFRVETLYPALDAKDGPVWNEISSLADRVVSGELVKIGCPGCVPGQECHAHDIAAAVREVAEQRFQEVAA